MTYATKRWLSFYFALLLGLAVFGSYNQQVYKTHRALIEHKETLMLERTELGNEAGKIQGAIPVAQWAQANGMVRVTTLTRAGTVSEGGAPRVQPASSGLELLTLWQ
jgi:hypothetical protein